jgi:hypothetical protein
MPIKVSIPQTAGDLIKGIPTEDLPADPGALAQAFVIELMECLREATRADLPQIVFNPYRKAGEQYIWEFYVNDLAKQRGDRFNFHGQNVSQWVYAGAIVLQNRGVSRHH